MVSLVDHCHGVTAWPLNMSNINTRTQGRLSPAHDEHVLVCHTQIPERKIASNFPFLFMFDAGMYSSTK